MDSGESTRPESGLWKDYLNRASVTKMADAIGRVCKSFDRSGFVQSVLDDQFKQLELKERIDHIAHRLHDFLPRDFSRAVDVLIKAAPHLGEFENWALTAYVQLFGLQHLDASIRALKELTEFGTAEFAVRPFVIKYPERMLAVLTEWVADENEHVRRLTAEASRPRGVWVAHIEAFKKDPRPVLKLLDRLKADPSPYVRKAVANNLNDISKDHPNLVIETALSWKKDDNQRTNWIIKHACRSLIKKGDRRVFSIFGFTPSPRITISNFKLSKKKVRIGEDVRLSFDVTSHSKSDQKLAIDYKVHYVKANGTLASKVFKLAEKQLHPGETISLSTRRFFQDNSTRKHHPGRHRVELIVNGCSFGKIDFRLTT